MHPLSNLSILVGTTLLNLLLPIVAIGQVLPLSQINSPWFVDANNRINEKLTVNSQAQIKAQAKNVILFVGDGMGVSTLTAARILDGQLRGESGEENFLSFERFPYTALVKTYNVDAQTPDSAGTMTAMMSGLKTDAGVIGVDEDIIRGDCSSQTGNEVVSALQLAEVKGLSTGLVSTARITHATPAAAYAKSADRSWEGISSMPEDAVASGCVDIASQLIDFAKNIENSFDGAEVNGMEVAMGGGRRHFLPADASANSSDTVSETEGLRTDGRNLIKEWQSLYPQGQYVFDKSGFNAVDASSTRQLLGLFNESHMRYEVDRTNDIAGEPSLTEMTSKAIDVLSNNANGYLLVVESGRIDHAHHAGSAYAALYETVEFSKAVQAAVDKTSDQETMIMVTADHSHVFTMAGYPKRGNPILGKVVAVGSDEPSIASDGLPYTTLGYINGRGFADLVDETNADAVYTSEINAGREDLTTIITGSAGFHQEALVPLSAETHGAEDIALHGIGPGAHLIGGVIEQNNVYHIINFALGLAAAN